jgi:UDP-N-acetyl-D-mannosaminuronic acid dehydrogenase
MSWDALDEVGVVVVGGCGHVGLPLTVALANQGLPAVAYDISEAAVATVNAGRFPFLEDDGPAQLEKALAGGRFAATTDVRVVSEAQTVIVVTGTPIDEHLNPDPVAVLTVIDELTPHLRPGQLLVLRSTVYPGVTQATERRLEPLGVDVAFCPERIAEGHAFEELGSLPQIVAARTSAVAARAAEVFRRLTPQIIETTPEEAELAKLFTNTWRYLRFAAANQLFMMANDHGVDFERVRAAMRQDYPRAADIPGAGFAAGPCLLKDTMQLAAFHQNDFTLGHAAMMVNEGLPAYLVRRLEQRVDLTEATVGILGMAFKGGSDDTRSSLSYRLKRLLRFRAREVLCTDPYVSTDPGLTPLDEVLARSDVLFVGAPHPEYRDLDVSGREVVDVWDLFGRGVLT